MPGAFNVIASSSSEAPPGQSAFTIVSQKVDLDVDFANRSISGTTDIVAQPLDKSLRFFRLHCAQCRILRATVQGRPATVTYADPYQKLKIRKGKTTIRQYEYLRSKIDQSVGQSLTPELIVTLPPRVTVKELDHDQLFLQRPPVSAVTRHDSDGAAVPETPILQTPVESAAGFATIDIRITFDITDIKHGLQFAGFDPHDGRYPHLYTRNMLLPGTARSLFPCLDTASDRCTWEISIRCPKTLGDAFRLSSHGESANDDSDAVAQEFAISLSEEDQSRELVVVCSGDTTDDIVDPHDKSRRTVSFACSTPVPARHMAFAIGPFEQLDLSAEFRQIDEDEKLGQSAIKVLGYCLPGRASELRNTCMPLPMAIDYYTVTFGSFPFSSYQICFVDHLREDTTDAAGLSVCSNQLLFGEDLIDPLDSHTRLIVRAVASQYSGVNVIPKDATDTWTVTGIAGFMTDVFMKKLAGNNEFRLRQKLQSDRAHEMDVDRYSIHQLGGQLDIDPSELSFLRLKSALVLFILDRRLTKASGSAGLSRIITRLFLHAKTGSLPNGELSTDYFLRLCEKMGHTKLDSFFRQWVYGAGCPDFKVSQGFNKKKLVVEMIIEQTQTKRAEKPLIKPSTFLREAKEQVAEAWVPSVQPVFVGPMTIRIHEADGTPYEHIVEIKDLITRIEVPYNTKYKRLKRTKRNKDRGGANDPSAAGDNADDVLTYCLGDTLQSERDMKDWRLVDWDEKIEAQMNMESYEWIRLDADFEWIARFQFPMKPYMYVSQLQQDRDVVAQYESLQNITNNDAHPMMSTILIRTLMDNRYFHGIRTYAAQGLAKCAVPSVDNVGLFHLEKAFQELFCADGSTMPRPNDFSDRARYLLQCAIPRSMVRIRDNTGSVPLRVRQFLLEKLKFNDNSLNDYSDNFYLATLLTCLADTVAATSQAAMQDDLFGDDDDEMEGNSEDERIKTEALGELDRYRRMDEWVSSYHNIFSTTAILSLQTLLRSGAIDDRGLVDILQYTRSGNSDDVRLQAFIALVELKAARKTQILKYILHSLADDPSPYMRASLLDVFGQALGSIAIGDEKKQTKPETISMEVDSGLVLEQDVSTQMADDDLERKTSPAVALDLLKDTVQNIEPLQQAMWHAIQSPKLSLEEVIDLLDVAALIFDSGTMVGSVKLTLTMPRMFKVTHLGQGLLRFNHTHAIRWKPSSHAPLSLQDWKRVQSNGLKYTGPLTKEAQETKYTTEGVLGGLKLKLGLKPQAEQGPMNRASSQMPAPPLPSHSEGPLKLSLKRKQSTDGARLASPKLAKAPRTNPLPSPMIRSRSPSSSTTTTQRAVGSASTTPGPKAPARSSHVQSRIVKFNATGIGDKIGTILSSRPANKKGVLLKVRHVPLPTSAESASAPNGAGSPQPNPSSPPGDTGFFQNLNAMNSGWNMGTFRNFGGDEIKVGDSLGDDLQPALLSAISPRTVWPVSRPGTASSAGVRYSPAAETAPGPVLVSTSLPDQSTATPATDHAAVVKEESSDEEPLIHQHKTPEVPAEPPKRLGVLKLKLGRRP